MGGTPHQKKGLINEMLERIAILERRLDELENNKVDNTNRYYTIDEISDLTGYSKNTIYRKIRILEKGKHYFKPNGGKLIFDESSIEILIKGSDKSAESIYAKREPIFFDEFFHK